MPPGEPDALLHIGRPEHLASDDAVADVRREPLDRREHRVRDLLAALAPGAVRERVRNNWANTLMVWRPGGATDGSYGVWK